MPTKMVWMMLMKMMMELTTKMVRMMLTKMMMEMMTKMVRMMLMATKHTCPDMYKVKGQNHR